MTWGGLTATNGHAELDTSRVRQGLDFFEVRSDGSGELLGWVQGIDGVQVEREKSERITFNTVDVDDEDMSFVVESDEFGAVEIRDQPILSFRVRERKITYRGADLDQSPKPYENETPRYATRTHGTAWGSINYTWRALAVSAEEAELLFDYPEFVPHTPKPNMHEVAGLLEEELFHGKLPRAPQLEGVNYAETDAHELARQITRAVTKEHERSNLGGSWTPSYPGRAGSGFQS
ncbi:hypothetical protein [Methylobacterium sp. AMS5]|uniref:hypothetical protein n=1 Tax=Methylobacterium sp. AMS5 TaxID=925818 RepID=UPI00074F9F8C|nr:hypothetical protein [Methylobacterium sp. AMS5]AMB48291.1 hypothetical protein Y590_25320 [Methylobacterium sp. AMS5]